MKMKCLLIAISAKSSQFIDLEILFNRNMMIGIPLTPASRSREPYLKLCVFNGLPHWSYMTSGKSSGKPGVPLAFSCTENRTPY